VNKIYVGINNSFELPKGGYLLLDDEVRDIPRSRVFDPKRDAFNPLKDLDYRKACDFLDTLDTLFPSGENTLTKDTGLDFIGELLETCRSLVDLVPEPHGKASTGHLWAHGKIRRILRSPVLSRVLTGNRNLFSFNPRSIIQARINRAELGEFDALALGLLLISQYKGQVVIVDGGFYLREMHSQLIRENRLIAHVNVLEELPPRLRRLCLLEEIVPCGTTFEDARTLAEAAHLLRGTNEYNDFVHAAMTV
jgi:hypothetical protein